LSLDFNAASAPWRRSRFGNAENALQGCDFDLKEAAALWDERVSEGQSAWNLETFIDYVGDQVIRLAPAISAFAAELLERKRLTGDELREIYDLTMCDNRAEAA